MLTMLHSSVSLTLCPRPSPDELFQRQHLVSATRFACRLPDLLGRVENETRKLSEGCPYHRPPLRPERYTAGINSASSNSTFTFAEPGRGKHGLARSPALFLPVADHDAIPSRNVVLDDDTSFHFASSPFAQPNPGAEATEMRPRRRGRVGYGA
jgi:hypothetical protein